MSPMPDPAGRMLWDIRAGLRSPTPTKTHRMQGGQASGG